MVLRALTTDECLANIKSQVTEILLKQPWQQTLCVRDASTGDELDIEHDTELYLKALTRPRLDNETLAHYKAVWPFHAGFGACCDHAAFHLPEMWQEIRRSQLLSAAC